MKNKEIYALGIMSGTSLDGLDFSLIKSDGLKNIKVLFNHYFKFNSKMITNLKDLILEFNNKPLKFNRKSSLFIETEKEFTDLLLKKIKIFFNKINFEFKKLSLIGVHGNTLLHNPKNKISLQLGDFKLLSNMLKIKIVANFRDNDIKLGGEGAPLVPISHQAMFSEKDKNIMVVNIGGISNFSFLIGKNKLLSSDIGPGNTLIDKYCFLKFKKFFDKDGKLAKKGNLKLEIVEEWLKKKFLKKNPPYSFDNSFFKVESFASDKINKYDILRSLTFFSAKIISDLRFKINLKIDHWIFTGGGVKNYTLMKDIRDILHDESLFISDELGFDSSFIESVAFAYISIRTVKGLPSAFPETTGCCRKNICGKIYLP